MVKLDHLALAVRDWRASRDWYVTHLGLPVFADDFPGGERRIVQKARGYRYTIVNGTVTFEEGRCTGALPGKLLRSGA